MDHARSKNLCMRGISMRENRGGPTIARPPDRGGPQGKGSGRKPLMHDRGKSDGPVVPAKLPNNAAEAVAEAVEERGPAKGNTAGKTRPGLRAGVSAPSALDRVRRVAQQDKEARFTALLHHVDVDCLRAAYAALKPKAAPGVDGVTWLDYRQNLEENLRDLHGRVHRGSYRARPSRRAYIPKADGRLRPLGIAALEDKRPRRPPAGGARETSSAIADPTHDAGCARAETRTRSREKVRLIDDVQAPDRGQQGPALD